MVQYVANRCYGPPKALKGCAAQNQAVLMQKLVEAIAAATANGTAPIQNRN